jgi:hypothetical protein
VTATKDKESNEETDGGGQADDAGSAEGPAGRGLSRLRLNDAAKTISARLQEAIKKQREWTNLNLFPLTVMFHWNARSWPHSWVAVGFKPSMAPVEERKVPAAMFWMVNRPGALPASMSHCIPIC